jgi:hypothetical protein
MACSPGKVAQLNELYQEVSLTKSLPKATSMAQW